VPKERKQHLTSELRKKS